MKQLFLYGIMLVCMLIVWCKPAIKEQTPPLERPLSYVQITGNAEILSGTITFTGEIGEAMALLQIPVNKRSTLYLSGNGESQAFLIVPDNNLRPSDINKQKNLLAGTLEGEVMQTFDQVKTDTRWYRMVHFAGSRAGPTIFQLPTNFPEFGISILVMILRGDGTETFREVSNKEPYLVNEGGMVFKYLSGNEEYGGSYQGFDLDGKIVPLNI